ITLALSFLFNGILVIIVHKRRERVGFYRYFTFTFVLVDILYSTSFTTAQPFWYTSPGVLAFFSVAPWNEYFTLVQVSYQIWFVFFIAVLLCITSSFIYRYGLLCRDPDKSLRSAIGTIISTVLMQIQLIIMVCIDENKKSEKNDSQAYCGWQIHKTVKMRAMSDKLKDIHSRALFMLIAQ
ncbi:hypothetical protein PENTCL1PPCAC_13914, partial [Pristionchus entomophagus]